MTEMSSDDLFHKRRHSKLSESADVFRKKFIFKEMYCKFPTHEFITISGVIYLECEIVGMKEI